MKNQKIVITVREGVKAFAETAVSLLSWFIGYPLTHIIKRDRNLTAVIIRSGSVFTDNSKYFFVYANEIKKADERVVLLTSDVHLQELITKAGAEAILHPTLRSLFTLLKCGNLVADNVVSHYYPLSQGATFVQLWHGAPLKHIELDLYRKRLEKLSHLPRLILRIQKKITGRHPTYDIVVATSQKFIQAAFRGCFKARRFIAAGYPRNDILFGWPEPNRIAWRLARINVDQKAIARVEKAKREGKTICLYAPTFRQSLSDPFSSAIDLSRLSEFARQNNIVIALKLHPVMHGRYEINQYPSLLEYDSLGDAYPLMAMCDILITDYSSIYFDYLLLDRPIIFFPYDLDSYLGVDRDMYFDYDNITPGIKCRTQQEMENCLKDIISKGFKDNYAEMRSKIKSFTHDHSDNQSCQRLIDDLRIQ